MGRSYPSPYAVQDVRDALYHYPDLAAELGMREDMPFVGEGAYGAVWVIDDHRVVKITRSFTEAENLRAIVKKRIPHVVYVHRVETLGANRTLIVMERLQPIPQWAEQALDKGGRPDRAFVALGTIAKVRARRHSTKDLTRRERRFFKQIDTAFAKLMEHNVRHHDMHDGNIMVNRRGNFKVIDVM